MITWQESLAVLKNGNKRFIQNKMHDILQHDLKLLSETQNPHTVILCCSDSRVSPDIIFDQSLGNLFVIKMQVMSVIPQFWEVFNMQFNT